ncbi:MAG: hypothetical protein HYW22_01640 [Candidatus Aenigmarchaeota archaeon]|nr:hypothetical protein [Candidatus Aenigmarchaeota archaeon]
MRVYIPILVSILAFTIFVGYAGAVPFNASVTPTSLNAGQTSQLLNFTIENNGSADVGQVNITLPSGFTYAGSSGTSASNYTFSSAPIGWSNISSTQLVSSSGGTQYFWLYVNTPTGSTGSYNFNVSVLDANGVFNSTNVPLSIVDTLAPTYTTNTTTPSSNATYAQNQDYWFNITWTDGIGLSKVLFESNFTGSLTNQTMSNESSVFYRHLTDLSAGNYVWRVYANDTSNTFNSTSQLTYLIAQATNTVKVYLNGTLNANITSTNNTAVNITVNSSCPQSGCTITITLDGSSTLVSGGSNPIQYIYTLTSPGIHTYNVTVAGNTNYTTATSTYYVATTPTYSTSTLNVPLTWANNTISSINVTFDSNPSLQSAIIQGDWTGTATNYTMSNLSSTRFYYNTSFPAGTINWKIYGVYSGYAFLLGSNSFTINPLAANVTLNIIPQWTLDVPIQTNVSCTVAVTSLTAKLYRNGSAVSIPDVNTFNPGDIYVYICNNTINQNFTTVNLQNTVFIRPKPLSTLSFVQSPSLMQVTQGSSDSTQIKVKNTGTASQDTVMTISGIDSSWYSIKNDTITILPGLTGLSTISLTIPSNAEIKDYNVVIQSKSSAVTITQNFTLRVLPSNDTKTQISNSFESVKSDIRDLENKINGLNSTGANISSSVGPVMNEIKGLVSQTQSYIAANDYFNAYQTIQKIKSDISNVQSQLSSQTQPFANINIPGNVWLIIGGVVVLIIVGVAAYLAWPVKEGYSENKGGYKEGKPSIFEKIKNFFSGSKKKEVEINGD